MESIEIVESEEREIGNKIVGEEREIKKRRKSKKDILEEPDTREQNKFFIDVSKDLESRDLILGLLKRANNKERGREIILKDLVLIAIQKLQDKDFERIQESSLSKMDRLEKALNEYNSKMESKLGLEDFLLKKLNL